MPWREWWEGYYGAPGCGGCHDLGPALGYGFDNFDNVGRIQTEMRGMPDSNENFYPVDTRIKLNIPGLPQKTYPGAPEALQDIASAESVGECFARHWLAYLIGMPTYFARNGLSRYKVSPDPGPRTLVDHHTACARLRGETYLADLILSLVSSPPVLDHIFPCGPKLCLSSYQGCLEIEEKASSTTRFHCDATNRYERDLYCEKQESREGSWHFLCQR